MNLNMTTQKMTYMKMNRNILVWTLSIYLMITLFVSSQAQNYMWTIAGSQDTIETNSDIKSEEKIQVIV